MNRDIDDSMIIDCDIRNFSSYKVVEHIVLENNDKHAVTFLFIGTVAENIAYAKPEAVFI